MHLADLDFQYPAELIATEPQEPCRILYGTENRELSWTQLQNLFQPGDLLILNDTLVEKRRVFSSEGLEFLFLNPKSETEWEVLFPAKSVKDSDVIQLPENITARLIQRGLPQVVQLNQNIDTEYFQRNGELALPPYIQKARDERHNRDLDKNWYQTAWAKTSGSAASPTASLHFSKDFLKQLKAQGVNIEYLTLHVGMGTFLPIKSDDLSQHKMHSEWYQIPEQTIAAIEKTKGQGGRIWAMGTTAARALESFGSTESKMAETTLFIQPGYDWKIVSGLLTNFHQPKTTLLSLVAAFANNLESVKRAYQFAIEKKFRLFSYGDLTVWTKP